MMRSRLYGLLLAAWATTLAPSAVAETQLTVMSFNAWGAGLNAGKPLDETLAVLRAANADLVGLQETRAESDDCSAADCPPASASVAPALAAALGYRVQVQEGDPSVVWANAILSRHPVLRTTPQGLGVVVEVDGRRVALFNIHPTDYPYQPYQLLKIPYGEAPFLDSAEAAVEAARAARGPALEMLLADLDSVADTDVQIVTGDFNEPSWRDWSPRAVAAGRHPLAVAYPLARALEAEGFVDAFRSVHPDEMARPGYTWTPTTAADDPADHHDRIDFVFVRGAGASVERAVVVGEDPGHAGLVVTPWPSDHRAVLAEIRLD